MAALALGLTAPADAGDLKLTMQNGRVTLDRAGRAAPADPCRNGPGSGNTKIVNAEKVVGSPITLELVNVPGAAGARHAAAVHGRLHRGAAARRRDGASLYDRIMILPTSRPPAAVASAAPPPRSSLGSRRRWSRPTMTTSR